MVFYDPVFGICFLPEILTTVGRIHISRKKHTGETDVLDLDSDAEHRLRSRSIQYSLSPLAFGFCKKKLGASNYSVLVDVGKIKRSKILS